MDCTLQDSLRIFRKWKENSSRLAVKANIGPASFSVIGKVGRVDKDKIDIAWGAEPFTLRLSGAMFNFDDTLKWPDSRKQGSRQGTPVSGLWVNLFMEKQLVGGCLFLELQDKD
jgi:hypothetical protein